MLGIMVIGSFVLYFLLARFVVTKVYEKTQNIKYKRLAIALFLLIPTWDIIIGYPVYKYYCYTQSGEKIYKTVENIDGVYVGTLEKNHIDDPHDLYKTVLCHSGRYAYFNDKSPAINYQYVDYKEKESGKYFRTYWLDNNTSKLCVHPRNLENKNYKDSYTKAFMAGQCIAKEEIAFEQISRYGFPSLYGDDETYKGGFPAYSKDEKSIEFLWVNWGKTNEHVTPIALGIKKLNDQYLYDRYNKSYLSEHVYFSWKRGLISSLLTGIEVYPTEINNRHEILYTPYSQILKPSKKDK